MGTNVEIGIIANTAQFKAGMAEATQVLSVGAEGMKARLLALGGGFDTASRASANLARETIRGVGVNDDLRSSLQRLAAAEMVASNARSEARASWKAGETSLLAYKTSLLEINSAMALVRAEQRQTMASFVSSNNAIHQSSGMARAGLQGLGYQLSDVATQFAGGARAGIIFAQQGPQVVQAIQMMSGEATAFSSFMSGPWGVGIMVGVAVLGALWSKLGDNGAAMKDVTLASDGLNNAQSTLGQMFDLTTGKLSNQNEMLRLNAQLMAINLRAKAATDEVSSAGVMSDARRGQSNASFMGIASRTFDSAGLKNLKGRSEALAETVRKLDSGRTTPVIAAKWAESFNFDGLQTNRATFLQSLSDSASAQGSRKVADLIDASLSSNSLAPGLRNPASPGKSGGSGSKGRSANDNTSIYDSGIARLAQEELRLRLNVTDNLDDRYSIQQDLLEMERQQRVGEITANKKFTEDQKKAQLAYLDRIYGKPSKTGPNGEIITDGPVSLMSQKLNQDHDRAMDEKERAAKADSLSIQLNTLRLQDQLAKTTKDRRAIELEMLRIEEDALESALKDQISKETDDAEKKRLQKKLADLQAQYGLKVKLTEDQTKPPLQAYVDSMTLTPDQVNERVQGLVVDELEAVRRGIDGAITNALGIKDPLLAGLVDLFIQQVLIRPIAEALQGASGMGGGGGGFLGSVFSILPHLFGFADGTSNAPPGYAWVGERGPELLKFRGGEQVIPNHALGGGSTRISVEASPWFDVRVNGQIMQAAPAVAKAGSDIAQRSLAYRQSRSLAA